MHQPPELRVIDGQDHRPVGPPLVVDVGRDIQAAADGQGPVGAPVGFAGLQPHQELAGPGDDAGLPQPRHRAVDFQKGHPHVESERPVCGKGDHPGIAEQITVALIEQHDIVLHLARDVGQRFGGQGRLVAEHEVLGDAQSLVAPSPAGTVALQRHRLRVGRGELAHQRQHRVPARRPHVWQYRIAGGVGGEDRGPLGQLALVFGVDVDHPLPPPPDRGVHRGAGRLHVGAVSVAVEREGERERLDQVGGRDHRFNSNVSVPARDTQAINESPACLSLSLRNRSRWVGVPPVTGSRHSPHTPRRHRFATV